jgi:chemotaxis signal transduction protein
MGTALNTDYLIGLGTLDERMLILVDIDKLMSSRNGIDRKDCSVSVQSKSRTA